MKLFPKFFVAFVSMFFARGAFADYPRPWQIGFQEAATPVMEKINEFHNILLVVITGITVFVTILLAYTCIRYSAKNNPTPSKNSHNTLIEIIWTALPVMILVAVAIPSMRTLFFAEKIENSEMTVKVIGNQWYWAYQYPDNGNFQFDSRVIEDKDLKPEQIRLLDVDNHVVVPVNTNVRVQLTAADVIHSWAIPSFGIKIDAIPGRLNETWFKATKEGTYYGQCSELCGVGHGFMPIAVDVVSKEKFAAWVEASKKKFAANDNVNQVAAK